MNVMINLFIALEIAKDANDAAMAESLASIMLDYYQLMVTKE